MFRSLWYCVYVFVKSPSIFVSFVSFFCFCAVIQFESTRSSSPTECCRFSPWSRKVVVPPPSCLLHLPLTCSFCNLSPVLLCLTPPGLHNQSFVKRMPTSCSVFSVLLGVCCETEPKWRLPPHWHVMYACTRMVTASVHYARNVWVPQSVRVSVMRGFTSGGLWLPMIPLCCGFLAVPVLVEAVSRVFLFIFQQIYQAR